MIPINYTIAAGEEGEGMRGRALTDGSFPSVECQDCLVSISSSCPVLGQKTPMQQGNIFDDDDVDD